MSTMPIKQMHLDFKTASANRLLGLSLEARDLHELMSSREKPAGRYHMRYEPEDLRRGRYALAGITNPDFQKLDAKNKTFPAVVVMRMTKGGVGKTAVTVNTAMALAMSGYRVLVIDADPQASASNLFKIDTDSYDNKIQHIGKFLMERGDDKPTLENDVHRICDNAVLDLIAADITLAESDAQLMAQMGSHEKVRAWFKENAEELRKKYDVILVDTAPGTTPIALAFTFAAARSSGKILTVVEPEGSCIKALESLQSNLDEIARLTDSPVKASIVINKYAPQLKHVPDNVTQLRREHGENLMDTIISQSTAFNRQFGRTLDRNVPLIVKEPLNVAVGDLIDLSHEIVKTFGITQPGLPSTPPKGAKL